MGQPEPTLSQAGRRILVFRDAAVQLYHLLAKASSFLFLAELASLICALHPCFPRCPYGTRMRLYPSIRQGIFYASFGLSLVGYTPSLRRWMPYFGLPTALAEIWRTRYLSLSTHALPTCLCPLGGLWLSEALIPYVLRRVGRGSRPYFMPGCWTRPSSLAWLVHPRKVRHALFTVVFRFRVAPLSQGQSCQAPAFAQGFCFGLRDPCISEETP